MFFFGAQLPDAGNFSGGFDLRFHLPATALTAHPR
jgi:hypothetical protein